jgi:hypothetical protein
VAMAVDVAEDHGGKQVQKMKEMGAKRQENGSVDPHARFHPQFILPCKRQPIRRDALCPYHALRIPRC